MPNRFQLPWLEASQGKPAPHFPFPKGGRLGDFYFLKRRRGVRGAAKLRVILSLQGLGSRPYPYRPVLARELREALPVHICFLINVRDWRETPAAVVSLSGDCAGRALRSVIKPYGRNQSGARLDLCLGCQPLLIRRHRASGPLGSMAQTSDMRVSGPWFSHLKTRLVIPATFP